MRSWFAALFVLLACGSAGAAPGMATRAPLPDKAAARLPDVAVLPPPSQVHLGGFLGERVDRNTVNRLLTVDLEPLLAGYRKRPGNHPWIGEHIGKWLHAAALAWANTGDARLRAKLDYAARELIRTQEPDGYLGTYTPDKRFGLYPDADWDVWSHKYNLIGLLTYYQYTGSPQSLHACVKMGDLLLRTFGPGRKSILSAGTHGGMASTSVLEPMVLLYRATGDARYLDFCRYLVASWEQPGGPHIVSTLTAMKSVNQTGNGKAYEMLSNLVGLCELARATGERRYLTPVVSAWQDIVRHQRYVTGTASYKEHFHRDGDLPNRMSANVGETCVTVTWIQLNVQLLRLTGQARYGDEIERSLYNHLAAAQKPDGSQWCYYTALEGVKPYGTTITCCASSGPRGIALAPQLAYFVARQGGTDTLSVNLPDTSRAVLSLGGQNVTADLTSDFPRAGRATLTLHVPRPARFGMQMRSPGWAGGVTLRAGRDAKSVYRDGWARLAPRTWKNGDTVTVRYALRGQIVRGTGSNQGLAALCWGPFVLACDDQNRPALPLRAVRFGSTPQAPRLVSARPLVFTAPVHLRSATSPAPTRWVPFADAGATGSAYRVWLPTSVSAPNPDASLLETGEETRTAPGNVPGSILDNDPESFVVTYNNQPQQTAFFAVTLDRPATVRRVVFVHGQSFHDGGWFDTRQGKPRIEVQRTPGVWEPVATLDAYPDTTAARPGSLRDGQPISVTLVRPETVLAVRVIGAPAHGDNRDQAFASCAELQAFAR